MHHDTRRQNAREAVVFTCSAAAAADATATATKLRTVEVPIEASMTVPAKRATD